MTVHWQKKTTGPFMKTLTVTVCGVVWVDRHQANLGHAIAFVDREAGHVGELAAGP
jgi:hypothetical protein